MNDKKYDLEDRTLKFAESVRNFCKEIPYRNINISYIDQLIRSSSSVGANYIEANCGLGKKDFIFRCKIARKEAKEAKYWLHLLDISNEHFNERRVILIGEINELLLILSAIILRVEKK